MLALPLLWAAFADDNLVGETDRPVALLHHAHQDRVITAYRVAYGSLPASIANPVMKIPIVHKDMVMLVFTLR